MRPGDLAPADLLPAALGVRARHAAARPGSSICEWKGVASYLDVLAGDEVALRAAWTYPDPRGRAVVLVDHVAVYAAAMDACLVDGVPVTPQPGGFYGGWVTSRVTGPFKGAPGTMGW